MVILLSPLDSPYHSEDAVPIAAGCGHQCWIGPTSLQTTLSPFMKTQTTCLRCAYADPKTRDKVLDVFRQGKSTKTLPGILDELRQSLGEEEAERTIKRFEIEEWDGKL